jgi:hypothetical protein
MAGRWAARSMLAGCLLASGFAAQTAQAASVDDVDQQEVSIRVTKSGLPQCVDTPVPDPAIRIELMPVHEAIGHYIAYEEAPAKFTCTTASFEYRGERTGERLRIVSRYRGTRQVHADVTFGHDEKENNYKREGVMRSFWRNGRPQSLEYFCHGFPVGFHRYFDREGKLTAVVDFSRSDYAYGKIRGDAHSFHTESPWGGTLRLGSVGSAWSKAQWFREVFRIEGGESHRVLFHVGSMGGGWKRAASNLRVTDWTTPGDTSSFEDGKQTYRITNLDFGYESLADLYQRKRAGESFAGIRVATRQVLECPVLDEAMSLALEDPRFAFTPLSGKSPPTIDQMANQCLGSPTVDCLIKIAGEGNRRQEGRLLPRAYNLARTAMQIGRADLAREILTFKPEEMPSYRIPSPPFAEPFALRAQAERALGLQAEAEASLTAALQSATTNTGGYEGWVPAALGEAGIALARAGRLAEAEAARQALAGQRPELEITLRLEIALGYARRGDEAKSRVTMSSPLTPKVSRQPVPAPAPTSLTLLPRMEIAAAQFRRKDSARARDSLARVREAMAAPGTPAVYGAGTDNFVQLMGAMASAGEAAQAVELFESSPRFSSAVLEAAAELCASHAVTEGLALAAPARASLKARTPDAVIQRASLALVDARCGRRDEARKEFARALADAGKLRDPPSDEIGPSSASQATEAIVRRMMAAGLFDDIPPKPAIDELGDPKKLELDLAVARARAGLPVEAPEVVALADRDSGPAVQRVALARAEILARQHATGSAAALARTRQLALTEERDSGKALNLALAANLQIDLGDERTAKLWLDEAFAIALRARERSQANHFDPLPMATPATALARGFARIGDHANAERVVAEVESGAVPAKDVPDLDRVYGELALAKLRTGDADGAAQFLRQVQSPALRTLYLAKGGSSNARFAPLWKEAVANVDAIFAAAEDAAMRRRLVHALLGPGGGGGSALRDALRQQVSLIADESLRARASCELAAAYHAAGDESNARISWASGASGRSTAFKAPHAAGACAAWMRAAGDPDAAAILLQEPFAQVHKSNASMHWVGLDSYSTWFRELALVQYENDRGEMFPEEGWFLIP